jgi:ankyrin repeat protein
MDTGIWRAAKAGDLAEVMTIVGQDQGLLDAGDVVYGRTALMLASREGHVGMVRWLLDKGAAMNERSHFEGTALWFACHHGRSPVVRLLLERGADPTIASSFGSTPLITASFEGHVEVVRSLLGHASAKATINHRELQGLTALWGACAQGHGGVARALLEEGADLIIAANDGTTPMAAAMQDPDLDEEDDDDTSAEGRRECVAALEVRLHLALSISGHLPFC